MTFSFVSKTPHTHKLYGSHQIQDTHTKKCMTPAKNNIVFSIPDA
jgi:hypothetical protein